jgi:protein-tyrosine-phosphatase
MRPSFTVLLVCTGNLCRSALAERLGRSYLTEAFAPDVVAIRLESAGTAAPDGAPMHPDSALALAGYGVDAGDFRARRLRPDIVAEADLVLAMTREHRRAVLECDPRAMRRTFTLREAAALLELREPATPAGAGLGERARSLVQEMAAARACRPSGDLDDIADPIGQPGERHRRMGADVAAALLPVLSELASLRTGTREAAPEGAAPDG